MKLQYLLAIIAVILVSQTVQGHKKRPYPQKKKTTMPPTTTLSPTVAALETTTTKIVEPPVPTTDRPIIETTLMKETLPPATKPPSKKTIPTLPPVDFDCRGKDDGYYPDPKDKCSSKYYACVGGLAREMTCATPSLAYEPDTKSCERRHESRRCTGTRKTTLATTPHTPPPPPPKSDMDCSNKDDGWFADPLKKCSHTFYSCSNGIASKFDCPGNMYFDSDSSSCHAWPDVFACSGKKRPTTLPPTKPPVTEKLPIDCSDKPSGQLPDPAKKCSDIYYVCSNGDGFKRSCPPGLFYHAKKQRCDYFDEIFACTGKTKPPTKPTMKPEPSPASLPSDEFKCADKADGSYTPEDKKCSEIYYRCINGVAYKRQCPDHLVYDMENDLCDRKEDLPACTGKPRTTPLPTKPTEPKPTEKLPIDCSAKDDGDFPDPDKKCSKIYYSCSNGGGSRRQCQQGLYFDKDLRLCERQENIPDCSGKTRAPTTTTKRPAPPPKHPYDCEKRTDGYYAAGKCLDYYWACVGGSTIRTECAPSTVYDEEVGQCGYRHEIPACGGVRPTTEKP